MRRRSNVMSFAGLLLALGVLLLAAPLLLAPHASSKPAVAPVKAEQYLRAHHAFEEVAEAYWQSVIDKRRLRYAKRANGQPIALEDYVLTQPPVYSGPPRPPGTAQPGSPRLPIPVLDDFVKNAAEQHKFVPQRPENEMAFKRAYAKVALAAGLTAEQAVRVYGFETGGDGGYDSQSGLTHPRPNARAISPAMGYNQLLSTNTLSILAEHGDRFIAVLTRKAETLTGAAREAMERKIAATQRMVAFSRTVPGRWPDQDRLAKTTPGGIGVHAAVLDIDLGPLLQTQKLLDSVEFARSKGYMTPLTGAELELMNFTGDGNGFDLVTMPAAFRPQVPTSNFFQRGGYSRNPIAKRTGVVAALFAAIDGKMDRASQLPGAQDLAQAFTEAAGGVRKAAQ